MATNRPPSPARTSGDLTTGTGATNTALLNPHANHIDSEKGAIIHDEKQHHLKDGKLYGVDERDPHATYDHAYVPNNNDWEDGWDHMRVKRVLRKMDIHLLPFVSLLYLLSFL